MQGNYLGTDDSGSAAIGNGGSGIQALAGSQAITIGGTNPAARNLISGNHGDGLTLNGLSNSVVQGNYIGTDVSGSLVVSNTSSGIDIFNGAQGLLLGGTNAGARNLISGNGGYGIEAQGPGAGNLSIFGNLIGLDITGAFALPNGTGMGLFGGLQNTTIGGTTLAARNYISGNRYSGILVGGERTGTLILGNYIGVATNGLTPLGNGGVGIAVYGGAATNAMVAPPQERATWFRPTTAMASNCPAPAQATTSSRAISLAPPGPARTPSATPSAPSPCSAAPSTTPSAAQPPRHAISYRPAPITTATICPARRTISSRAIISAPTSAGCSPSQTAAKASILRRLP